jgi:hypothetical protein
LIALNSSEDVFMINNRINLNKMHATVSRATAQANNLRLSLPSDKIKADDDLEDEDDEDH